MVKRVFILSDIHIKSFRKVAKEKMKEFRGMPLLTEGIPFGTKTGINKELDEGIFREVVKKGFEMESEEFPHIYGIDSVGLRLFIDYIEIIAGGYGLSMNERKQRIREILDLESPGYLIYAWNKFEELKNTLIKAEKFILENSDEMLIKQGTKKEIESIIRFIDFFLLRNNDEKLMGKFMDAIASVWSQHDTSKNFDFRYIRILGLLKTILYHLDIEEEIYKNPKIREIIKGRLSPEIWKIKDLSDYNFRIIDIYRSILMAGSIKTIMEKERFNEAIAVIGTGHVTFVAYLLKNKGLDIKTMDLSENSYVMEDIKTLELRNVFLL